MDGENAPRPPSPERRTLCRIVVFWVGADVVLPEVLVRSVRRAMGSAVEIVQLTDQSTPQVAGVDRCKRMKLSQRLMVARLEACAAFPVKDPTLYLDADMLVLRDFDLPPIQEGEVGVTSRTENVRMDWQYPIEFPEFKDKYVADVMPYLYSFVYCRSEVLFVRQLNALRRMPRRFQEWYGDQVTLKAELEHGPLRARILDGEIYNKTIKSDEDVMSSVRGEVCVAHFKGPTGKYVMPAAFEWISAQTA